MAVYATVEDVQARLTRDLSADERSVCAALLEDAAAMIDALAPHAPPDARSATRAAKRARSTSTSSSSGTKSPPRRS